MVPILKWAGGKRQLLPVLQSRLPKRFGNFYEPFVGGGALLIDLYNSGCLQKAVISDLNLDVFNLYQVVKTRVADLILHLTNLPYGNKREDFLKARARFNSLKDFQPPHPERAALMLYLNRHCYNGLYRVNSRGEFNVPFGRYKNPSMPGEEQLLLFHEMLQQVEILNLDFEKVVEDIQEGDFVYFDPPYVPLSSTANFTSYTRNGFGEADQIRLARVFKKLDERGAYVMVSNADVPLMWELFQGYSLTVIGAPRRINSDTRGRHLVRELIITNYQPNSDLQ